ncbi:MAG: hypothetical protein ACXAEN_23675 [Candidatus Thorarchaeota archaeon]|jgi:hypothetical protein
MSVGGMEISGLAFEPIEEDYGALEIGHSLDIRKAGGYDIFQCFRQIIVNKGRNWWAHTPSRMNDVPHLFLRVVRDLDSGKKTDWIIQTKEWVSKLDSLLFLESEGEDASGEDLSKIHLWKHVPDFKTTYAVAPRYIYRVSDSVLRFDRNDERNEFLSKLILGREVAVDATVELEEIARRADVIADAEVP